MSEHEPDYHARLLEVFYEHREDLAEVCGAFPFYRDRPERMPPLGGYACLQELFWEILEAMERN